jgi:hypothetical protein
MLTPSAMPITPGSIGSAIEITVADINSPTELNAVGSAQGELRLARTVEAGDSQQTLYYLDTTSSAQSLPYVVTSLTAGLKWVAVSGHACNQAVRFASDVRLNAETASRIVTTDSNKDLDTPATVTTGQSLVLTAGTIQLDAETASRLVITDAGKQLDTPASITTAQSLTTSNLSGTNTGDVTLAAIGSSPNANGASLSGQALTLQPANDTFGGVLTAGTQDIAGSKLFQNTLFAPNAAIGSEALASGLRFQVTDPSAGSFAGFTNAAENRFFGFYSGDGGNAAAFFWSSAAAVQFGSATNANTAGFAEKARFTVTNNTFLIGTTTEHSTTGGLGVAGVACLRGGLALGVTSTATAAGTTTLTNASTVVQIFTGATTQTVQLPAANLYGAGISVCFEVINRSTGTVTAQRAGADTFDGGGTTDAILTLTTRRYRSNGVSQWHLI